LVVEGNKDLVDFFSGFVGSWSGGHHFEKFIEFNQTTAVLIEFSDHLINSLGLSFNTECINSNLEF
jgi:hypothetical protein